MTPALAQLHFEDDVWDSYAIASQFILPHLNLDPEIADAFLEDIVAAAKKYPDQEGEILVLFGRAAEVDALDFHFCYDHLRFCSWLQGTEDYVVSHLEGLIKYKAGLKK
jgi:hypothetical protein